LPEPLLDSPGRWLRCVDHHPDQERPGYLAVALASVAPQAQRAGAELIVVDDGALPANSELAERFGARYVSLGEPRGLNARATPAYSPRTGSLLAFIDDDVEAPDGWLDALIAAAHAQPEVGVFTGPIRARLEAPASAPRLRPRGSARSPR